MIPHEAPFEYDFDICTEDAQYPLHKTHGTIIRFSITVTGILCVVRLVFSPFRRSCNLTYHEYEIVCLVPSDACREVVSRSKPSIIVAAQQLYDKCFSANAGYKLEILETE